MRIAFERLDACVQAFVPASKVASRVFLGKPLALAKDALHFFALVPFAPQRIPRDAGAPCDFAKRFGQPM